MARNAGKHRDLLLGVGSGAGVALVIALVVQSIVPAIAKVPGLVICGGGGFELVVRRRTSYGSCAGDADQVHYATIMVVSILVWSLVCIPIGIGVAKWLGRRRSAQPPR